MSLIPTALMGKQAGYDIPNSGAFASEQSDYLSKTFGSSGNRKTWTFSGWIKQSNIGGGDLFGARNANVEFTKFGFTTGGVLTLTSQASSVSQWGQDSTALFRDVAEFLHILVAFDTTESVEGNRVKIWVNNTLLSTTIRSGYPAKNPSLNTDYAINNNSLIHRMGTSDVSNFISAYLSEVHFIDGQALTPDDFAELNVQTGQWVAKKYTGTYGTNGFYLNFQNGANLGEDSSGNGNDFTNSGVTQSTDTPTNNICILNVIDPSTTATITNAGLTSAGGNAKVTIRPTTGKWYYEKGGVGVNYDCSVSGQFDPVLTADTYTFAESDWVGTPNAGHKEISTKNLPEPDVLPSSKGFVAVTATASNIESTLATARGGWTDYVDILKNRDSVESWAWQFSHDGSNEHAVASLDMYQAKRTNSGIDNWVGYSIRIGAAYGTAAGSVAHTNGANTTVTHNLANSNCAILLFSRTGANIYVYHPALTSGYLLKLNSIDSESSLTQITNITANSFDIGSVHTTGTYDYLVLTEVDGFIDLGSYTGNGSSDGPFAYTASTPLFTVFKDINATTEGWYVLDTERSGLNVLDDYLYLNKPDIEYVAGSAIVDSISNGIKVRGSGTPVNTSGNTYVTISFAQAPFKYTRAR